MIIFKDFGGERQRGGKGEKRHCMVASRVPPTGDLALNPGMCPDRESNQQSSQAGAQSTEPHQLRPYPIILMALLEFSAILPRAAVLPTAGDR